MNGRPRRAQVTAFAEPALVAAEAVGFQVGVDRVGRGQHVGRVDGHLPDLGRPRNAERLHQHERLLHRS